MVYIIIPVHNRAYFTLACLKSLRDQTYTSFVIIVVDDGSTDDTSERITLDFPEVVLLKGDGNLWWTGATNLGINYALSTMSSSVENFVLTLNDDLIVHPNYLQSLIDAYTLYPNSLVGSVSVDINQPDYMDYAGSKCNWLTGKWSNIARELYGNSYSKCVAMHRIIKSDTLPGRGTLIPVRVFQQTGLFDQLNFPHYFADIDFSLRAKKAGYPAILSTLSVVYSHRSATGTHTRRGPINLVKNFFSIRSAVNIKSRYAFAIRHSPLKLFYFLLDVGRIIGGQLLHEKD